MNKTKKTKPIIKASRLCKAFKQGENVIKVLHKANFSLFGGEIVALIGPSGCGKTTFLHVVGLLDFPDSGTIIINKTNYTAANDYKRTTCRRHKIGFIYQAHNLLADFTAFENVLLPLKLSAISSKDASRVVTYLFRQLQLHDRLHHYPAQLSGGEQQRVAIARSLVHNPDIILADEPTGNLDSANAKIVLDLLISTVRMLGKSLIIVTHNLDVAKQADRIITIKNGEIVDV